MRRRDCCEVPLLRPIRAQKTGFCAALENVGEVGAGYAGTRRRLLPNGLYELPLFDDINGTNVRSDGRGHRGVALASSGRAISGGQKPAGAFLKVALHDVVWLTGFGGRALQHEPG